MTTKKKRTRAIEKQADLSATDWDKLKQDIFAEIERRRFPATLGCGERPPVVLSKSEKVIQAFLAEVAEAAEAGVKIDLRPMTMSEMYRRIGRKRRRAPAATRGKETPPDRSGGGRPN
jgi:hypothetical protein